MANTFASSFSPMTPKLVTDLRTGFYQIPEVHNSAARNLGASRTCTITCGSTPTPNPTNASFVGSVCAREPTSRITFVDTWAANTSSASTKIVLRPFSVSMTCKSTARRITEWNCRMLAGGSKIIRHYTTMSYHALLQP